MNTHNGCQMQCLPTFTEGIDDTVATSPIHWLKLKLARVWNQTVKMNLKNALKGLGKISANTHRRNQPAAVVPVRSPVHLVAGDLVRVRSREEIEKMLDAWKELNGCAFLDDMWQYCGTTQKVFVSMERFLDERDYKVKKCKGIILLEGVFCRGTPVFGRCDRSCLLFWREEWLEKIEPEM